MRQGHEPRHLGLDVNDLAIWGILLVACFLPPLLFMGWVRRRENFDREPFFAVLGIFAYGGTLGVAAALVFSTALLHSSSASLFTAAVVIAPVVEEASKGFGLRFARRHMTELEDGLVYGAAAGLGFAATETFLYGLNELLASDLQGALGLVLMRTFSSMLLHASSSALLGLGYSALLVRRGRSPFLVIAYLTAVLLHAAYNYLVSSNTWLAFGVAIVVVIAIWTSLMRRLRDLDARPTL